MLDRKSMSLMHRVQELQEDHLKNIHLSFGRLGMIPSRINRLKDGMPVLYFTFKSLPLTKFSSEALLESSPFSF